ncbi:MAG: hypothetical protein JXQ30_16020 [Spirochaetes bacterium]|nr:hypothetical protein [Spirochaetota bacterium]
MSLLTKILKYWRFASGLRGFLGEKLSAKRCYEIIKKSQKNREQSFLDVVRKAVYGNKKSPYLKLLRLARLGYDDLERMVHSEGIESALHMLRDKGVYIGSEEFKCKKSVVRDGKVFTFKESDFNNPLIASNLEYKTGASRSSGTKVTMNFARYERYAAYNRIAADAHGVSDSPVILWLPILPSAACLVTLLRLTKIGNTPVRWFSQITAEKVKPAVAKRLAMLYFVFAGRLFGASFPRPEYVGPDRSYRVCEYIAEVLKKGHGCVIETYTSSAVRACQAARERNIDISGATFFVAGEPLTEAKHGEILDAGARAVNMYAGVDIGLIGYSCAAAEASGEVHALTDRQAVIQHTRRAPFGGEEIDAFLFTSLCPTSAKILLNVESGDYGTIRKRNCGCGLGKLGFDSHIYDIRGFDKLTGEGMTFIGTDLLRIVEEVLPSVFGGSSIDYQMVEEEDGAGRTCMSVIVNPDITPLDEKELIRIIMLELRKGGDTRRMMAEMWFQAGTLKVVRRRPYITDAGKFLPLYIRRNV